PHRPPGGPAPPWPWPAGGRPPPSQCARVALVERVPPLAPRLERAPAREQALALIVRIVELGERIADLHPGQERLEALDEPRVARRALGKRRQLDGIVGDERGLGQRRLDVGAEQVGHEPTPAPAAT